MTPVLIAGGGFILGAAFGALLAVLVGAMVFSHVARFAVTGRTGTVPKAVTHTPGLSPEVSAQFKISESMLDAATEDMVRQGQAAGRDIDRKAARLEAERMLRAIHTDWKGGIPNG